MKLITLVALSAFFLSYGHSQSTNGYINGYIAVDNVPACNYPNGTPATPLDCAFMLAMSQLSSGPQLIVAGPGVYHTNTGLQMTGMNTPINFRGADKSSFGGGTTIILDSVISTPVINLPFPTANNYWSNVDWTNVTIDANGNAPMCWDFEAPRDSTFAHLGCQNAIGTRAHWRFGGYSTANSNAPAGLVPDGYNGTGFQTTINDIFDIKPGATGAGAYVTATAEQDGTLRSSNDFVIGSNPGSTNLYNTYDRIWTRPLIVLSTQVGVSACSTPPIGYGVITPMSGNANQGTLTKVTITSAGQGCVGPFVVIVPDMSMAMYSGEIALTDSQVTGVVCNSSGLWCLNGRGFTTSSFGDFHPTNTEFGIGEWGGLTFTGQQECDSLYSDCIVRIYHNPTIPTSINNAYSYYYNAQTPSYPSPAAADMRLYDLEDIANLFINDKTCTAVSNGNCTSFGLDAPSQTNLTATNLSLSSQLSATAVVAGTMTASTIQGAGGQPLTLSSQVGQQVDIGGNGQVQVIFNGNAVYPITGSSQNLGLQGFSWATLYADTVNSSTVNATTISTGQSSQIGTTCTVAGYITLTVDGVARKLAICQ